MNPRKTIPLIALLAFAATACASVNTEPDETAVVYYGAMGSATKFEKCVNPSKRESVSISDNSWTYPAGQRTFDFSGSEGAESKPLEVVSKDNVKMTVPGVVTFALNTDCKTLQQFHDRIGRKFSAFFYGTGLDRSEAGWNQMLSTYLRVPLDRALDAASQEFEWRKLFNDPATKQAWEKRVGELARGYIQETARGQFFCQPSYAGSGDCGDIVLTIQKPEPPEELVKALAAVEAAKAQNLAQQQINTKVDTELESMRKLVDVLGPEAYVQLKAVESGKATVVVGGSNGVNVNAGQK
ncbi:SPFH domain-containing protein [Streptosporangium lutulentum]|uniref:Regulator of protease activity HflC (Stomatin/prohibitin superfamily) n=1 Tax=Streptosporangium lutulentum TaxID=1461250 RepID=A0ABT9Q983_9ACTN|nr:SPFH domain-containing protein [Streptosporangium lutulentum]MDP9843308.1 regulator of protease activity HflC (stomatin/prohibitin superfamily) [Streptosporangium lutulentum]